MFKNLIDCNLPIFEHGIIDEGLEFEPSRNLQMIYFPDQLLLHTFKLIGLINLRL